MKFPIFWLGLLLFGYVTCQGLNPAYLRATAGPYWLLAPLKHVEWLPSGIDAEFGETNAWRVLVTWGGAWTLACALWGGVTRRQTVHVIITVFVINAGLLALLGILQKVTAAKGVFWLIKDAPSYFTATFYYKNHAGAYFNITVAASLALMSWHYIRSLRHLDRSSPAPVYAFISIVIAVAVPLSNSRTATVLLAGYVVTAGIILLLWRLRVNSQGTSHLATGLTLAGALGSLWIAAWFLNLDKSIDQIRHVVSDKGQKMHWEPRVLARQATMDLFTAEPITGWGAGSFRHVFPFVQRNYGPIYFNEGEKRVFKWDHTHNDYVEILAELGVVGAAFPLLMLLWALTRVFRFQTLKNPAYSILAVGILLPLAHSWVDFPLANPAILTSLCALIIVLVRWIEMEGTK